MTAAMLHDIKVPPLGESITQATVARWLKQVGDAVKADEPLLELETEKVTLDVAAPVAGIITEIMIKAGETVNVGGLLGKITSGDTPIEAQKQEQSTIPLASPPIDIKLSPAVTKAVGDHNLDPRQIPATGKDSRLTKGDVINHIETHQSSTTSSLESLEERVPMTRLRQKIGERLKTAQNTAAILTTFNEADMSAVQALRAHYKETFAEKFAVKLGFMSFFVKACVMALKELPVVNAEVDGTDIVYKNYYDIGVAVSAPQGLVVPIIRNADLLTFADIEKVIADLSQKSKDGKLTLEDLTGGTFTISNGGIFGSLLSTPILNPPQSAILGMHKIQDRPVVVEGTIQIRPMMYLALSYDHRLIDGRDAVTFLARIKEFIENPDRLLLEV